MRLQTFAATLIVTLTAAHSASYTIKFLNTPSLIVNGTAKNVGDTFDDNDVITWTNANQAAKVISDQNKIFVISASAYKKSHARSVKDFIAGYKSMSTRGDYPTTVADHTEMMTGTYELLDTIEFPSSWSQDSQSFFALVDSDGHTKALSAHDGNIILTRADVGIDSGEAIIRVVYVEKEYADTTHITDNLHLIILPEHL